MSDVEQEVRDANKSEEVNSIKFNNKVIDRNSCNYN